jgi:hypothetical protein
MKQLPLLLLLLAFLPARAQKNYWSTGGEMIFSWADYKDSGQVFTGPPRFTIFFHLGARYNIDFGKYAGIATGIGMRNIGFITKGEAPDTKIKRRSYTLGVPLYLKFGNMTARKYMMIGGEYEMTFHYKFKRFVNGDKVEKVMGWFSEKTNRFLPSVFVGYNYKNVAIKFQYYLDDFLNRDYREGTAQPYALTESRMFFVALMANVYNDRSKPNRNKNKQTQHGDF